MYQSSREGKQSNSFPALDTLDFFKNKVTIDLSLSHNSDVIKLDFWGRGGYFVYFVCFVSFISCCICPEGGAKLGECRF